MSYNPDVRSNAQQIEYQKFVEIQGDSRFPPISVIRSEYADSSTASVTSLSIYPKTAVLAYLANASDIQLSLSSSNLNIGDVGLLDHYTTGFTTYGSIIYTNTAPGGQLMGAVSVKPYGTTTVDGAVRITNTAAVSGSVIATILQQVPEIYTIHNFGIFTHRGWTMSDDLIPMITIRAKSTASKTVKILEYELGNNNANSSTIAYVWYEDATITGTVPTFSSVNADAEYRFYTDAYGSNTPNGFTGGTKRHGGIVIGKNSEAETALSNIPLSANGKNLTLCVQRLDSATKLDLWAAITLGIF